MGRPAGHTSIVECSAWARDPFLKNRQTKKATCCHAMVTFKACSIFFLIFVFLCDAGCEARAWCIPRYAPCLSCFPGSAGRDVVFLPALPRSFQAGYRKGQALGAAPAAKSFKGNQAFGWQGHRFHICSFRILCCYSTYRDLGCPLPSAKTRLTGLTNIW